MPPIKELQWVQYVRRYDTQMWYLREEFGSRLTLSWGEGRTLWETSQASGVHYYIVALVPHPPPKLRTEIDFNT